MTMHHDLPRFAAIVERASLVLNVTEPCVLRPAPKDTGVLQTDAIEDWAFCKPSRIVFTARHMDGDESGYIFTFGTVLTKCDTVHKCR